MKGAIIAAIAATTLSAPASAWEAFAPSARACAQGEYALVLDEGSAESGDLSCWTEGAEARCEDESGRVSPAPFSVSPAPGGAVMTTASGRVALVACETPRDPDADPLRPMGPAPTLREILR